MTGRRSGDSGTALVEFTHLSLLLMVPLVYVLLMVFTLQRAGFAVSAAAREAGRAYATAPSDAVGRGRAERAAAMTVADHRLDPDRVTVSVGDVIELSAAAPGLPPTRAFRVTVRHVVVLPVVGALFGGLRVGSIPVTGEHTAVVDTFRDR